MKRDMGEQQDTVKKKCMGGRGRGKDREEKSGGGWGRLGQVGVRGMKGGGEEKTRRRKSPNWRTSDTWGGGIMGSLRHAKVMVLSQSLRMMVHGPAPAAQPPLYVRFLMGCTGCRTCPH
jgi:hypothetical protein